MRCQRKFLTGRKLHGSLQLLTGEYDSHAEPEEVLKSSRRVSSSPC
jgi:hypothetical protein